MDNFNWQTIAVILIISVTSAIFIRRFFKKKSGGGCAGSGCHCPGKLDGKK